jgi:methionyl-tRNA formyltransferase
VAQTSRALSLPLLEAATVKEGPGLEALRDAAPDVIAVVAYGEILPREILDVPRVAPVNVHFSLLPQLRGADPVRRAVLEGLELTGVTTMRIDEGLDTGPILLQAEEPIRDDDDGGSLGERLAELGGGLLVKTLDGLEAGAIEERPQDERGATMAQKLRPEEEWIDWSVDAELIVRRIRALAPDPGARTTILGRTLKVLRAHRVRGDGEPGSIVQVSKRIVVVAAGDGAVAVDEVLPAGRRRMRGEEWARGRRLKVGERFGR